MKLSFVKVVLSEYAQASAPWVGAGVLAAKAHFT